MAMSRRRRIRLAFSLERPRALVLTVGLTVPCLVGLGTNANAMHRQSPPAALVSVSTADNSFPRLPPTGPGLTWSEGPIGGRTVMQVKLKDLLTRVQVSNQPGDNFNVHTTRVGRYAVWENDPGGGPSMLFFDDRATEAPLVPFPAGNPAVTAVGNRVFFESTEDLDFLNPNPTLARQIYHRSKAGLIHQVSRGEGTNKNPAATKGSAIVAYESTSDPSDGHDTGVSQIWLGNATPYPAVANRITAGAVESTLPQISSDGLVIAFQTQADLLTDGHDTGVMQAYVYTTATNAFARVTDDAGGCEAPTVVRQGSSYRVAFTCSGQAFFYDFANDQRYRVPMPVGSHTSQLIVGLGYWFLQAATTGNLLTNTGLHPNHQLYVINLYKRPALPVAGTATWFPVRGL
jgi:hypothetical protein